MVTIGKAIDEIYKEGEQEYRSKPQIVRLLQLLGDGEWHTSYEIDNALIQIGASAAPPRASWMKKVKGLGLTYQKRRPGNNGRIPFDYRLCLETPEQQQLFRSVLQEQIQKAKDSPSQSEAVFTVSSSTSSSTSLPLLELMKESSLANTASNKANLSLVKNNESELDDIPWTDEAERDSKEIPCPVFITDDQLVILEARGVLKDLGMSKMRVWTIFLHHCMPYIIGCKQVELDLAVIQDQYKLSPDDLLIWHELYNAMLKRNVKRLQRQKENASLPLTQLTLNLDFSNQ